MIADTADLSSATGGELDRWFDKGETPSPGALLGDRTATLLHIPLDNG